MSDEQRITRHVRRAAPLAIGGALACALLLLGACGSKKPDPAAVASSFNGEWTIDLEASVTETLESRRAAGRGADPRRIAGALRGWEGYIALRLDGSFSAEFRWLEGDEVGSFTRSGTWADTGSDGASVGDGVVTLTHDEGETTLTRFDDARLKWEGVEAMTLVLRRP